MSGLVKMIASDIDGTLLDINHNLPLETEQSLLAFSQRHIPIMLATGKSRHATRDLLKRLSFLNDAYGVFINGALLVKKLADKSENGHLPGYEICHELPINQEDVLFFLEHCIANKIVVVVYSYDTILTPFDYSSENTPLFDVLHDYHEPKIQYHDDLVKCIKQTSMHIHKMIVLTPPEQTDPLYEIFSALPGAPLTAKVFKTVPCLIEIQHADCNKLVAIKEVCKRVGCELSEVMAFGDGTNDMEMISGVGWGVCMSNGYEGLKAVCDDVCMTSDESGVTRYLQAYFE